MRRAGFFSFLSLLLRFFSAFIFFCFDNIMWSRWVSGHLFVFHKFFLRKFFFHLFGVRRCLSCWDRSGWECGQQKDCCIKYWHRCGGEIVLDWRRSTGPGFAAVAFDVSFVAVVTHRVYVSCFPTLPRMYSSFSLSSGLLSHPSSSSFSISYMAWKFASIIVHTSLS